MKSLKEMTLLPINLRWLSYLFHNMYPMDKVKENILKEQNLVQLSYCPDLNLKIDEEEKQLNDLQYM